MNYNDYQQSMKKMNLITNPIAEEHLAEAMVCQANIKHLEAIGEDEYFLKPHRERKTEYINRAIKASWPWTDMRPDWEVLCTMYRNNLIELGMTRELYILRPVPMREARRIIKQRSKDERLLKQMKRRI